MVQDSIRFPLPLAELEKHATPFYYYDMELLDATLDAVRKSAIAEFGDNRVVVHYAVKANANPAILSRIPAAGFGADCVSGGEIKAALDAGFLPENIVYAGVGKTDDEILYALDCGIGCFNVESPEELDIIEAMAAQRSVVAPVALRVNPNIDAHTHAYITTGLKENKFGIDLSFLDDAVDKASSSPSLNLLGLHFHIGSQITIMEPFSVLGDRINGLIEKYATKGIKFRTINVGGGLGIDYDDPDANPISPFGEYFSTLRSAISLSSGQQLHCELGRSIVGECGSLITRVIYVKKGISKQFVIVDAGMNDLIRPALYGAHHVIQNLTAKKLGRVQECRYDIVGPICESSDTFAADETLPLTCRGDIIAIRSAGAYGETMSSTYNLRKPTAVVTSL